MKKFLLFLIWMLFTVSCEKITKEQRFGGVDGVTFIGSTNEPIQGLRVDLTGYNSKVTDENGYYKFENVLVGDYTVSVYQDSRFISSKPVTVIEGNISHVWFSFEYEKPQKQDLPEFSVVDVSQESEWDYQVFGKEEYFYIDVENSLPKSVFYHHYSNNGDYGILFDDKGLPKTFVTEYGLLLFDNFNGNKFDMGILPFEGEMQIIRGIETDFVLTDSPKSPQSRADIIKWTGRVLGAVSCGASIAAAATTGGFATYLAVWTCGNYFLKITSEFLKEENIENGFTNFVDKYSLESTVYACAINPTDPTVCLTSLAQAGLNKYADYVEEIEVREYYVNRLEVLLADDIPSKTLILQPGPEGKDARISSASFNASYGCTTFYDHSGSDTLISVVHDQMSSCSAQNDRMLIQFSVGPIPADAVVSFAQLELYGYGTINYYNSVPSFAVYEVKESWGEETVSWEDQPEIEFIGETDFVNRDFSWRFWDVTNVVQDWISGRKNNFGFEIVASKNTVWGGFYSGDYQDATKRPRLVITYY